MTKILHILTGPPGSGKTTYAQAELGDLKVFDRDLGNKSDWVYSEADCVLCTSAPARETKEYWISLANFHQFTPILHCFFPPRMVSYQRMSNRQGIAKGGRTQQNNLVKSVERWYKKYSRHRQEIRHE